MILRRFVALALLSVAACASRAPGLDEEPSEASLVSAKPEATALRLERAERSIDVGRDVRSARLSLEALIADPSITSEQRDQARLAMSRASEAAGDKDSAVGAVEDLLADHPSREHFPLEEVAQARLRALLTGIEAEPAQLEDATPASPFARALASRFTAAAPKGPVELEILAFGGSAEVSNRLGTFALGRAFRDLRREACPVCDDALGVDVHSTRAPSWLHIPRERSKARTSMMVIYFDLGANRVPARYDAELPMPSAEIAARLERGEGLVAVRERPNAPPVVLIAAPRTAELSDVEEWVAALKTLPTEPLSTPLKHGLRAPEIQAVVRASFGGYRSCYEALLKFAPTAAGTARVHFTIRGDGTAQSVKVEAETGLVAPENGSFERCLEAATRRLSFPPTGVVQTVIYPIVFTPG